MPVCISYSFSEEAATMICRSSRCYFTALIAVFVLLDKSLAQITGSEQTIAFYAPYGDDIAFEGETVTILCSQAGLVDAANIHIYNKPGKEISAYGTFLNETHGIALATLTNILNNMTLYCNISGEKMASVKLSIFTIPRETSPHCFSNYTNGLLEGDSVQMTCYNDAPYGVWEASSGSDIEYFSSVTHTFTVKNVATVRPPAKENGTIYSCISTQPGRGSSSCSTGPMIVYRNIRVSFEPNADLSKVLSPGESRNFNCLSTPSSNIQWMGIPQNNGVVLDTDGSFLSVNVLSNSTFRGNINLLCVGEVNGVRDSTMLSLQIVSASLPAESGAMDMMDITTPISTESTKTSSSALNKMIILIILGAIGGFLMIIIVFLFTVYFYGYIKIRRTSTKAVKSVATPSKDALGNHDYALPPYGETTLYRDDSTVTQAVGLKSDIYTVIHSEKEKDDQAQTFAGVSKGNKESFVGNIEGDVTISKENNSANPPSPAYAFVNKNRRILIDSAYLEDEDVF
ncbi:hypothetical protein HOLleu_41931 [Holothuria leucospilota]|uniref:Uncharacterized protein n=1 Tax=Holothuria leucospilota TaxID=206669 RepID=A0A9Q0YGL4_HOLLE|nr:hypothetical protein HOLleu_41931 [Holothuria leucospilota]